MRTEKQNRRKPRGLLLITLGLLLIAAAPFLLMYNLGDGLRAERSVKRALTQLEAFLPTEAPKATIAIEKEQAQSPPDAQAVIQDYVLNPHMEMPVKAIDGANYIGVLRIPALELELPVIGAWNYSDLKIAPCRYSGSAYLNNLIICGHNYTAHFGYLKNLSEGDLATFTDMDGNEFTYKLVERDTLPPGSVDAMESGDWDLTLFTCTVDGQRRVTLRFELLTAA